MHALLGLRRAALLTAFGSLVVVSCGTETIDLLPPDSSAAGAGAGNAPNTAAAGGKAHSGGDSGGGDAPSGGAGRGSGGVSGAGGSTLCIGLACGLTFAGFGGNFFGDDCDPEREQCQLCESNEQCPDKRYCSRQLGGLCVECTEPKHCGDGYTCEVAFGQCVRACDDSFDCVSGKKCDQQQRVCVQCIDHLDCPDQYEHYCSPSSHRCVECLFDTDCPGKRPICAGGHCIECYDDAPCGEFRHCNIARGRCED